MSAGAYYAEIGRLDDAAKLLQESADGMEFLTRNWPNVRRYRGIYGGTLSNLAMVLSRQKRDLEQAETLVERAIDLQHQAQRDPEIPHPYLLNHYLVLAQIRLQRERYSEAVTACEEGRQVGQKLLEITPNKQMIDQTLQQLAGIKEQAMQSGNPAL